MGRKKKKVVKPWCWYCNRDFDDEKILIQHQKAKHFKCHICHKKLYTGPGLAIHCMQVHKETIDRIPNALAIRGSTEVEIYGMEGIPEADQKAHEAAKLGKAEVSDDDEPPEKRAAPPLPYMVPPGYPPYPGMSGFPPMHPGMMQGMMPGIPPAPRPPVPMASSPAAVSTPPSSLPDQPIRPTFPAYGGMELPGNSTPTTPRAPLIVTQSATTKIIHPEEDLSLEERRASLPKYQMGMGGSSAPPMSYGQPMSVPMGYGGGNYGGNRPPGMGGMPPPMMPQMSYGAQPPHYGMSRPPQRY